MDYHLVLILEEVLDRVTLTRVAIKLGIVNFLENSCSNMPWRRGIGCIKW